MSDLTFEEVVARAIELADRSKRFDKRGIGRLYGDADEVIRWLADHGTGVL